MYEIEVMNLKTKAIFKKVFDSYYKFNLFKNKCKYSKKVKVLGWVKL